jgi:hypothetical protein
MRYRYRKKAPNFQPEIIKIQNIANLANTNKMFGKSALKDNSMLETW